MPTSFPSQWRLQEFDLLCGNELHRAQQSRLEKGAVLLPLARRGEGETAGGTLLAIEYPLRPGLNDANCIPLAVCGQMLVANKPVSPDIDDADLKNILARLERTRRIHTIW